MAQERCHGGPRGLVESGVHSTCHRRHAPPREAIHPLRGAWTESFPAEASLWCRITRAVRWRLMCPYSPRVLRLFRLFQAAVHADARLGL
jgi:hypothetical protein